MDTKLRPNVFIGYDKNEIVAFNVAAQSVRNHCPSAIIHQCSPDAMGIFRRHDPKQSTDFAFCRFAVPNAMEYKGWSLFIDADIILRADVRELFDLCDPDVDVMVVKHDYECSTETKFLNQQQIPYRCKNWSSVMLFNNERCKTLSRHYVNTASGLNLHQFQWAKRVGDLPPEWNHLVGEYEENPDAKLVHYTLGTPCFNEYRDCEHSEEWWSIHRQMNSCAQAPKPIVSVSLTNN